MLGLYLALLVPINEKRNKSLKSRSSCSGLWEKCRNPVAKLNDIGLYVVMAG